MKILSGKRSRRSILEAEMKSESRWVAGGIALAFGVAAMAVYQLNESDGSPKVNGGSYLALFARPVRTTQERPAGSLAAALPRREGASSDGVDFESTATIRKENPPPDEPGIIRAPALEYVERGVGAFRVQEGLALRRVGESAPDGRKIVGFRRLDGGWVAIVAPQTSR